MNKITDHMVDVAWAAWERSGNESMRAAIEAALAAGELTEKIEVAVTALRRIRAADKQTGGNNSEDHTEWDGPLGEIAVDALTRMGVKLDD